MFHDVSSVRVAQPLVLALTLGVVTSLCAISGDSRTRLSAEELTQSRGSNTNFADFTGLCSNISRLIPCQAKGVACDQCLALSYPFVAPGFSAPPGRTSGPASGSCGTEQKGLCDWDATNKVFWCTGVGVGNCPVPPNPPVSQGG
jgi:hypothetical protein